MVTSILSVLSISVYALIDPGSTLSYITPFIASKCGKLPELLRQPLEVSTSVGESVVVRQVYRGCDVMIHDHHTLANLNELEMIEFDVIMGMDWLASFMLRWIVGGKLFVSTFREILLLDVRAMF
ncbi:uncharacterized protein [Nicotiana sylvestris]|uniref:uncharacterized protein n=1 Tax=Nicotiana sylvestris TaxID=4096 RepID=UPI00388CB996